MIFRFFLRFLYSVALRVGMVKSLTGFFPLWSESDAIYRGPAGPSATTYPEWVALKRVVANAAISDAEIHQHLSHSNPWVVGYCFEALVSRRSALLAGLPDALQSRTETVGMVMGCFRFYEPLPDYIRRRLEVEGLGPATVAAS